MTRHFVRPATLLTLLMLLICGCAGLTKDFETPAVSISSFKALPTQGFVPRFEIGVHIINPNRTPLDLKGVAYTISVEGHKILTGVANDLPRIEAYGEDDILLKAGVDLFSSILFFADLSNSGKNQFHYILTAKLDVGTLVPAIRVNREGSFKIRPEPH